MSDYGKWAEAAWTVEDILEVRPKMTVDEAIDFLNGNQGQIADDMVARGWDSIDTLLDMEGFTTDKYGERD